MVSQWEKGNNWSFGDSNRAIVPFVDHQLTQIKVCGIIRLKCSDSPQQLANGCWSC